MTDKLTVRAVYEDGVFKPLDAIDLPNKELVELEIKVKGQKLKNIDFEGALKPYWNENTDVEAIFEELRTKRAESFERLMKQIEGNFEEDDSKP
jgi:predicted DNA-binding antitoxin AbrB/MazE fold protein